MGLAREVDEIRLILDVVQNQSNVADYLQAQLVVSRRVVLGTKNFLQ